LREVIRIQLSGIRKDKFKVLREVIRIKKFKVHGSKVKKSKKYNKGRRGSTTSSEF